MINPVYTHDCVTCILLANDILDNQPVDIYVCEQMGSPTIIIRGGNEGWEYTSWNFLFFKESFSRMPDSTSFNLAYKYFEQAKLALKGA